MALFWGQECALCGVKMSQGDRLFATSHFIADPGHDLWRFSDAVMHWDCYAPWAHRRRFGRMYFESQVGWARSNLYWGIAHRDDRAFVTVNPSKTVGEVDVLLAETGSSFRIDLRDWEDWLGGAWLDGCHHEVEREALADVIPLLRSQFPSTDALIACAEMSDEPEAADAPGTGLVARISHELASRKLAGRVRSRGMACPHCGVISHEHRFVRVEAVSERGPQSHPTCCACGEPFGPGDV